MCSQIKPTHWIYILHNIERQLSVSQVLILDLNIDRKLVLCKHKPKIPNFGT